MGCFSGKTVVVTGATGLIGSHIVDRCMETNETYVIAVGRSREKLERVFRDYCGRSNFLIVEQDIAERFPTIDIPVHFIFHAAGPMERKVVVEQPLNVIAPNVMGTINCLEYLYEQRKHRALAGRLVLFSSVTVYENNTNEEILVGENETNVTGALEAINASYAQSKRMSEVIAHSYYNQYGVDTVIARFSTVYGDTRVIPDTAFYEFLVKAVNGVNIEVNNSLAPRRDNIFIDDAVEGVLTICEKGITNEAYNISSGGDKGNGAAIDEIAVRIAEVSNEYFKRDEANSVSVMVRDCIEGKRKPGLMLNNEKLKALGWKMRYSMNDGIVKTIKWYVDEYGK